MVKFDSLITMWPLFTKRVEHVILCASAGATRRDLCSFGPLDILAGVLAEGTGVAANCLKLVGRIDIEVFATQFSDYPLVGKTVDSIERCSPDGSAKQVFEVSLQAAHDFGHNYLGTEHLLIGLLKTESADLAGIWSTLGVDARLKDDLENEIALLLGLR